MSLIEEALRKQREETDRVQPAASPSPAPGPETPPPLPPTLEPDAPLDVAPEKSHRTWRMLAGIGLILVIVVAALIWMVVVGVKLFRTAPAASPAETAALLLSGDATQTQAAVVSPAASTGATVAVVTAVTPAVEPAVATTVDTNVATQPLTATVSGPGVPTGTVTTVPEEVLKPAVVWPSIAVSGIMGGGRTGRSTALINGQMMGVGDAVESARIIAIERRGVTFTYAGETRTLSVGASTE